MGCYFDFKYTNESHKENKNMNKEDILKRLLNKSEGKDGDESNNINVFLALRNEDWFTSNFHISSKGRLEIINYECGTCENCVNCRICDDCCDCKDCRACVNCCECSHCHECKDCTDCYRCADCVGCSDCENVIDGKNLSGIKFDKPTKVDENGDPTKEKKISI